MMRMKVEDVAAMAAASVVFVGGFGLVVTLIVGVITANAVLDAQQAAVAVAVDVQRWMQHTA